MAARTASISKLAALSLVSATLAACSGSLDVNLTDTPADGATSAVIDFTGIELHNTNGTTTTINFSSPEPVDLLQLQNGITGTLFQGQSVPTGTYDWIQLNVLATQNTQGQSYIILNTGAQYPLYIPSGSQAGLKLATSFTIAQGATAQLVIDFNLRQSVTATDGQNYVLVPVLRVANAAQVGTITADIDLAALATQQLGVGAQASQCQGGLFVFSGSAVKPQNGGGTSLVDFVPIAYDGTTTQIPTSILYLPQGNYTLAATCDYDLYAPTAVPGQSGYQSLHWTVLDNTSVTSNNTTTVTLPASTTSNLVN